MKRLYIGAWTAATIPMHSVDLEVKNTVHRMVYNRRDTPTSVCRIIWIAHNESTKHPHKTRS